MVLPLTVPVFVPTSSVSYGTPTLDLDFSIQGLADNDPISSVANLGSAGGSFTASGSTRPTFKTNIKNGLSIARFDGTNDCLTGAALSSYMGASAKTIFIVGRWTGATWPSVTQWQAPAFIADGSGYFSVAANTVSGPVDAFQAYNYDGGYDYASGSTTRYKDQWYVICCTHDGTNLKIYVDSGAAASTASTGTALMTGTTQIGKSYTYFLNGDIGQMLVYNSALNDGDRQTYRDQLLAKWGI